MLSLAPENSMAFLVDSAISDSISKLSAIVNYVTETTNFKPELGQLQNTLQRMTPIIKDVMKFNRLDRTKQENDMFKEEIREAEKLVRKCLKIKRNFMKKSSHSLKLKDINNRLLRSFQLEVEANQSLDNRQTTLVEVNYVALKMASLYRDLIQLDHTLSSSSISISATREQVGFESVIERGMLGWKIPILQGDIVGFEELLKKLKAKVLVVDEKSMDYDDSSVVVVVVVAAASGCGKTTLVTLLCYDYEIQAKFGENIFFVTVSEMPNFMVIVNDLFNPYSFDQPIPFQSDEDAKNKLGTFLSKKVAGPILIVLDGVWSNLFINKFPSNIKGCKIVVTSRTVFPKYGVLEFDPLIDKDAQTLFRCSAFTESKNKPKATVDENLVNRQQEQNTVMLLASEKESKRSFVVPNPICQNFSLEEIHSATQKFDEALVIGHGGFGNVYKGNINHGSHTVVAIKRLHSMSNQGSLEFQAEVEMLSVVRHCNLVSLFGYCKEGEEMALVYEYMPHGTLEDHLHKGGVDLSWLQRLKVCIGASRGLDYLHTGTRTHHGIIHRDVKSSNILLDKNLVAKISDFGLAKIGPINQTCTHVSTLVKGTFGYIDPCYYYTGKLTRKSDVYSFGVLLLEVICGRPAVDTNLDEDQWSLAQWAQDSIKQGKLNQIIDSRLHGQISSQCQKDFARIACRCLHNQPNQRPTMAEIVSTLDAILSLQERLDSFVTEGKFVDKVLSFFWGKVPNASEGESSTEAGTH